MKKILAIVAGIAGVIVLLGIFAWYELMQKSIVNETTWMYIQNEKVTENVTQEAPQTPWQLSLALKMMGFDEKLQAGKLDGAYKLVPGLSALRVASKICHHRQDPVRLTIHDVRLKEQLAGRMSHALMCDSTTLFNAMLDPKFLAEAETDSANVGSIFLPDTYEVYWNIAPDQLMERMLKEYNKYWTPERKEKAKALSLTPQQISTLASIAEEETTNRQERGIVARLYWNRLQIGMPLQADPTIKFALGDFSLKRILRGHLAVQSPYNTYINQGLPPGPIRIVEKATIDTILNSRPNKYIYMCAKPDFSGRHNFAVTLDEHQKNAAAYHKALNARQ